MGVNSESEQLQTHTRCNQKCVQTCSDVKGKKSHRHDQKALLVAFMKAFEVFPHSQKSVSANGNGSLTDSKGPQYYVAEM